MGPTGERRAVSLLTNLGGKKKKKANKNQNPAKSPQTPAQEAQLFFNACTCPPLGAA